MAVLIQMLSGSFQCLWFFLNWLELVADRQLRCCENLLRMMIDSEILNIIFIKASQIIYKALLHIQIHCQNLNALQCKLHSSQRMDVRVMSCGLLVLVLETAVD